MVITERTRLQVQAAEMFFFMRVAGFSFRDWVQSQVIRDELRVEPLLLSVKKKPIEVVRASGKDAGGVPGTSSSEEASGKTQD